MFRILKWWFISFLRFSHSLAFQAWGDHRGKCWTIFITKLFKFTSWNKNNNKHQRRFKNWQTADGRLGQFIHQLQALFNHHNYDIQNPLRRNWIKLHDSNRWLMIQHPSIHRISNHFNPKTDHFQIARSTWWSQIHPADKKSINFNLVYGGKEGKRSQFECQKIIFQKALD